VNDPSATKQTSYLPAERTAPAILASEIESAAASPVVDALLHASGAALAVVDHNRQLIAFNSSYLGLTGASDPATLLGARPGEALGCVHAAESPGGCGTCVACASCGSAAALLSATARNTVVERDCFLASQRGAAHDERAIRVRAVPLLVEDDPFVLLYFTDVSDERRRASLERVFLHDLANVATGLQGAVGEFVPGATALPDACADVQGLAEQLAREVRLQRALSQERPQDFKPALQAVALGVLIRMVMAAVVHYSSGHERRVEIDVEVVNPQLPLVTDLVLVQHVVLNMLLNAIEASRPGDRVRLVADEREEELALRVWSQTVVPQVVRPRIFQRFYTTKGRGRGLGTFSMKLFGEQYLGGRVSFTSSPAEGTWFELVVRRDGDRVRNAPQESGPPSAEDDASPSSG
jgi:signal transduction histidine kinase